MSIFKKNAETDTHVRYESAEAVPRDTIIGTGTMIEGIISSRENVCVEGVFKGKIMSDACIIIGETGKVEADITADTVLMSGEVHGNIVAKTKLEITSHGKLRGNIKTGSLIIAEGVLFEGNCQMVWEESQVKSAAASDLLDTVR
ncbi:MAG: polymer-forming cytoskeletal protein [Proteobacteria bacterium]|nr:polymer-forming cytoskeletal protein [Pseudomonadota bacterium]